MPLLNAIFGYVVGFTPREKVLFPQVTFWNELSGKEELLSLERSSEFYQFLLKKWHESSKENKVVAMPGLKRKSLYIYSQGTVTLHEVKFVFEDIPKEDAILADTASKIEVFDQEYIRENLFAHLVFQAKLRRLVVVK